ncbi:MAG: hypothetical protein KDK53_04530 [Maritimibacter sp.]|nr:hypothetical protein [Maritimibacter sp.]
MKRMTTRTAGLAAALVLTAGALPAGAGEAPEIPTDPLTVTCSELGIPEAACDPEVVTADQIRAMLVAGPLTGPAMAPLLEAGAFGPRGALPEPPEVDPPAEGEMPPVFVPVFDTAAYAAMLDAGISRTVVVEDLGVEVSVPVIDCRFAICLPAGMTGGPGFVDWEKLEMPEMPPMEEMPEAPAAE